MLSSPSSSYDDDPFLHRTYTAWQPLPSKDGTRLAIALEPRRVDADSQGVVITGWRGQVAGDGVVVVASDGEHSALTTVSRGFLDADWDTDTLFVWTKAASTWAPVAPNDMPPRVPYASVTWLDRETFAVKGTRTFDPPLEMPIAVGGPLVLDTPAPGRSDFERDVRIGLHDVVTGDFSLLHEGRGFAVSTCTRGSAVTVAYQRGTDKTTILDVVVDAGHGRVARLDLDDFLADAVQCRSQGQHIALLGGRPSDREGRALVLTRTKDTLSVVFENSVALPAALSLDGTRLLATGPDGGALLVTKTGARPLTDVQATNAGQIIVSGNRAVIQGEEGAFLIRLDGTEPSVTRVPFSVEKSEHKVFPTGLGGFLFFETTYDIDHSTDIVARAFSLDEAGTTSDIALDSYLSPAMVWADAQRAWIVGDHADGSADLVAIDLVGKQVSKTLPFPLCDRVAMRTKARCLP